MNSFTNDSNINHFEICQTPTKKRNKEGGKEKKSKRQKVVRGQIHDAFKDFLREQIRYKIVAFEGYAKSSTV